MGNVPVRGIDDLPATQALHAEQVCRRFEAAWKAGQRPRIEDYLEGTAEPERRALLHELIQVEIEYRQQMQDELRPEEYRQRFPTLDSQWLPVSVPEPTASRARELAAGLPPRPTMPAVPARGSSFGDYELLEEIARGGMGIVFKARKPGLNRLVALKMILAGHFASPRALARFRSEAENTAQLDHPNIVPIYDVGEGRMGDAPLPVPFFTMKLVEGGSLAQNRDRFTNDPRRAAHVLATAAEAVHFAHQHGILHRDLKPANILLDAEGIPHVTDFGLAKRLAAPGAESLEPGLTQSGAVLGTPPYMAPEQAAGQSNKLTTAADVYALGAILYEMLTGKPPFQAETPAELLFHILHTEPMSPSRLHSGLPRDLEIICLKCLQKDPQHRYRSAEALAEDLRRWLQGEPIQARPVRRTERLWRWARRNPVVALAGFAVAGSLLAGTAIAWYFALVATAAAGREAAEAANAKARLEEANRHAYVSALRLTAADAERAQLDRALELLAGQTPDHTGGVDLRGFEWYYWRRFCHADLPTLKGHLGFVTSVAFSPDGKQLATGNTDYTMKLWEADTGRLVRTFDDLGLAPGCVAFSPDGKQLACCGSSYDPKTRSVGHFEIKLLDMASGREVHTLQGHTSDVRRIAFSPDGLRLASAGGEDRTVKVWDVQAGREVYSLRGHEGPICGVAFSPDSTRLASAGWDATVKVWDVPSGREVHTLRGHSGPVAGVAFSPNGLCLASASWDFTVKLWDPQTGREIHTCRGHTGVVHGVSFSPDGKRLASASDDQTLRVWDVADGRQVASLRGGGFSCVAFSPDGKRLASATLGSSVKIWDAAAGQEPLQLRAHTEAVASVVFSRDGGRLATAGGDRLVKVWDAPTGRELLSWKGNSKVLAFSPDGTRLAGAGFEPAVKVWDAATGRLLLTFPAHTWIFTGLDFSPDGTRLAGITGDGTRVTVWDLRSGEELQTLAGHTKEVLAVAFSPDGAHLASAGQDWTVKVWDGADGREVRTLRGHGHLVTGLAFSPDSTRLASVSLDRTVRVWDVADGREVISFNDYPSGACGVTFSPDGKRLALAHLRRDVSVVDVASGQEFLTLPGLVSSGAVFSPDGRRLAVGCENGTLIIWDARPLEH
jgi:WD40 repeat protein